jgi:hypothetical protein
VSVASSRDLKSRLCRYVSPACRSSPAVAHALGLPSGVHRARSLPLMRAIGKAPHVLCFDAQGLQSAIFRQGMEIVSVERHGTRGKDIRVFIVARKPAWLSPLTIPNLGSD